ncbi:MAG: MarR family transcriptional regulator [Solirubrobacterales bacterium]
MADDGKWWEELALPVLLAEGRTTYGRAIRKGYAEAGFDDIPKLGPRLLGGIFRFGGSVGSAGDVARDFGVSKQAASKLIDTLVIRGYLERGVDPEDRRRLTLELTERGRAAAEVSWKATDAVDRALETAVGAAAIRQLRETVGALVELRERE